MLAGHGAQFEQPFLDRLQTVGIEIQIACRLLQQGRALGRLDRRAVERRDGRIEPSLEQRRDGFEMAHRRTQRTLDPAPPPPTRRMPGQAPRPAARRFAGNCAARPVPPPRRIADRAWSIRRPHGGGSPRHAAPFRNPRSPGGGRRRRHARRRRPRRFEPIPGRGRHAHRAARDESPHRAAVGFRTVREFRHTHRPRRATGRR